MTNTIYIHQPEKAFSFTRLPNFLFEAPTFKPLSNEAKENRQKITDNCCSKAIVTVGRKVAASELAGELVKDEVFFIKGGGVTLSGGEPLRQSEFCERIMDILGKKDINRAIETSFYAPYEKCFRVLKKCEQIYIDMKFFSADDHIKFTGKSNEIIKNNIKTLITGELKNRITVRTPLIPGITATKENLKGISEFLYSCNPEIKYELLNYNPLASSKYQLLGIKYCFEENIAKYGKKEIGEFVALTKESGLSKVFSD